MDLRTRKKRQTSPWIIRLLGLLIVFIPGSATAGPGICFLPDGLVGPCCQPANVVLPVFPEIEMRSKFICWESCDVRLCGGLDVRIRPVERACGYDSTRFSFTAAGGALSAWSGKLLMLYLRTWSEGNADGPEPRVQVWRFLVNGGLTPSATLLDRFGNNDCVVPPCALTFGKFQVTGYVDYALDCATKQWSVAFVLDHDCDVYEHDPCCSTRPGVFHPSTSYSWAGPEAGFVPDPGIRFPSGTLGMDEEAFRNNDFSLFPGTICQFEQPLAGGVLDVLGELCPCGGPGPLPAQYSVQSFTASSLCGSNTASIPFERWPGLVSKSIGVWTGPAYPGPEETYILRGWMTYFDGCDMTNTQEYFQGVETAFGYPSYTVPPFPIGSLRPPINSFQMDVANAVTTSGNTLVGSRYVSNKMTYGQMMPPP